MKAAKSTMDNVLKLEERIEKEMENVNDPQGYALYLHAKTCCKQAVKHSDDSEIVTLTYGFAKHWLNYARERCRIAHEQGAA